MKFTGIILNLDGQLDSAGDSFPPNTQIELPETVHCYYEFDKKKPLGIGKIIKEDNLLKYEIDTPDNLLTRDLAKLLTPAIGGQIIEREGNIIRRSRITEIGLSISSNADKRIKKLGEE